MSVLRPSMTTNSDKPAPTGGTAYLMILKAVEREPGLIHGKLHDDDAKSCAIGSYFNVNKTTALRTSMVDEVAAVNDSVPHMTPRGRKRFVMTWLKWKLATLGMPGYGVDKASTKPRKKRR